MHKIKTLFLIFFALPLGACGTILSGTSEHGLRVYSGTRHDLHQLGEGGFSAVLATLDLPFSFVLDTLLLPVTLAK